jgi:hypothetical protein
VACRLSRVQKRTTRTVLAFLAIVAGSAAANDVGTEARFSQLDRNSDGFMSRDEAREAEELNTRFSELDINNDGKLTRDEYAVLEREAREAAAKSTQERQAAVRRSSAAGGTK